MHLVALPHLTLMPAVTSALANPRTTEAGRERVIDKLETLGYEVEDDLSVHKAGEEAAASVVDSKSTYSKKTGKQAAADKHHNKDGSGDSEKSSNESGSSEHEHRGESRCRLPAWAGRS